MKRTLVFHHPVVKTEYVVSLVLTATLVNAIMVILELTVRYVRIKRIIFIVYK
jgi:hypothetical protein